MYRPGSAAYCRKRLLTLQECGPTNRLDASGGGVFRNLLGAAEGALIRAAASTQPLSRFACENPPKGKGARLVGLSIRGHHRARQDDGLGLRWGDVVARSAPR